MYNFSQLPFVKSNKLEPSKPALWHSSPSGDYLKDLELGRSYALQLLSLMSQTESNYLLGWVVEAIQQSNQFSGIEIGFMSGISDFAVLGIQQAEVSL